MEKITKLTPEQEAQLPVYRDKWIKIALSTGRMTDDEREAVVEAVYGLYEAANLARPEAVLIVPSPLAMAMKGAEMTLIHDGKKNPTPKEIKATAARFHEVYQGGNMWAGWCSFLDFWSSILGEDPQFKEQFAKFAHWRRLAELSGFRWMHAKFCIVSEKPVKLETVIGPQGNHIAHCEDGPTHLWGDGWGIWHWNGVRVPRHVIEKPDTITVAEIKAERNAEVRRVMRERFGEGRYLIETGAKVIDSDHETARKGAAPRVLLEDDEGLRFLVGTDGSTNRVYYMQVDAGIKTCREAHESICGFSEEQILNKS